jgi:hypothetical protein
MNQNQFSPMLNEQRKKVAVNNNEAKSLFQSDSSSEKRLYNL